jgi:hypothetical protein
MAVIMSSQQGTPRLAPRERSPAPQELICLRGDPRQLFPALVVDVPPSLAAPAQRITTSTLKMNGLAIRRSK